MIYYTDRLSLLFLKKEEKKLIQNLVILHPHWLIEIMSGIVEKDPAKDCDNQIEHKHVLHLESGVASMELLKNYLTKFISGSSDITLNHLLLILRSYCLIFPLQPESKALDLPKYIVPCKLPDDLDDKDVNILEEECCIFYFDFCQFLPDEIYHRLICLASAKSKPQRGKPNIFSERRCMFHSLFNTYWIMEAERKMHRLKFTVLKTW